MPFRVPPATRSSAQYAAALIKGQRQLLQLLASGAPLQHSLTALLTFLESLSPDLTCSILLLDPDGIHLRHGAAPSLPADYIAAIDGSRIGPTAGSCGTSAFRREPVIVSDIRSDALWDNYRHLTEPHGFRACWSIPVVDAEQRVLGTFALYRRRRGSPSARHRQLIDVATQLAAVAIGRWRVEGALQESEQRFNAFMNASPAISWVTDEDGRHVYMNRAWERAFGLSRDDYIGRTAFDLVSAEKAEEIRRGDAVVLQTGQPLEIVEDHTSIRGETQYWHCVKFPFTSNAGQRLIGGVAINRTRRTKAEQALKAINATLEQKVTERTAELEVARARAESADRLKSAFLATMSHELRTPLNSIIGFTGIVLKELAGPLNPEQTRQLGMVRNSARHLLELINDVLDLSKIEAGQIDVRTGAFDLGEVLVRTVESARPFAESRGLEIRTDWPAGAIAMTSDRRRVEQILLNVLNNALKFTDAGHVTVTARVSVDSVAVQIADTGIGIRPADLETLFQPFRQVDTGLARQHDGTGLGLAICRRLATLLGGHISATSEWARGSVFTVSLPRERTTA